MTSNHVRTAATWFAALFTTSLFVTAATSFAQGPLHQML
ncbi:hypothetical protein BHE75_01630 [Sphingomonas haloaromaticamans]|uniref:Uncharacterized protein n=1 Tax=Edaphosphingomonas haloaromaticamans TaxID=653954 RepID=A0A1S1HEK9_9SPHN|nr:hypothetical protein BHE75_01630 [Sphingomonas haloaromaticamans]